MLRLLNKIYHGTIPGVGTPQEALQGTDIANNINSGEAGFYGFLSDIATAVLTLLGIVSLGYLVYAGYQYVMSKGQNTDGPKKMMQYSIVGVIVGFGALPIINFVLQSIGVTTGPTAQSSSEFSGAGFADSLPGLIANIFGLALVMIPAVSLAYLVYGGYKYVTSKGSDTESAKKTIQYSIVGLIIAFITVNVQVFVVGEILGTDNDIADIETGEFSESANAGFNKDGFSANLLNIFGVILALSGVISLAYIVYGGYRYMQSRGSDTEGAKKTIIYACVGLVIIFLALNIQQMVLVSFLGNPQVDEVVTGDDLEGKGFTGGSLQDNVQNILRVLIALSGVVSVAYIVYGGYQYIMSKGDTEKPKKMITYALVGLVVVLLAFSLQEFILSII